MLTRSSERIFKSMRCSRCLPFTAPFNSSLTYFKEWQTKRNWIISFSNQSIQHMCFINSKQKKRLNVIFSNNWRRYPCIKIFLFEYSVSLNIYAVGDYDQVGNGGEGEVWGGNGTLPFPHIIFTQGIGLGSHDTSAHPCLHPSPLASLALTVKLLILNLFRF